MTRRTFTFMALVAGSLVLGCRGAPRSFLVELDEARKDAADLRVQFTKATDASNRAVMADTDEASIKFARDAEATTKLAENDLAALGAVLRSLRYEKELLLLDRFEHGFAEYRKVDREILALAVENTNLKAQRLSFGAAREAADDVRASLAGVVSGAASKERCKLDELVNQVVLAVRETQVLQAPHIAEADDAAMARLENEMTARKTAAHAALASLTSLVGPNTGAALAAAGAALDRFDAVSAQIVSLSRRNTNVRSLDLALRVKPPLTANCDDVLRALQEALSNEGHASVR